MSKTNLYLNIYLDLLEQLKSPIYKVGDEIPTAVELASLYSVSRPTIHKALKQLQDDGLIKSRAGQGSRLIKKPKKEASENKIFGLIFPLLRMEGFFSRLAVSIASLSEKYNYNILWGGSFFQGSIDFNSLSKLTDLYIEQKVDGIFMSPVELTNDRYDINTFLLNKLERAGIQTILIDAGVTEFPENIGHDIISIDNYRAGYTLAQHMLSNGSNRIDFFTMPNVGRTVRMRLMGVQSALIDAGIYPQKDWVHLITEEDNLEVKLKSMGSKNIITSNDFLAVKIMKIIQGKSFSFPEDFRIAGFDGSYIASEHTPRLTTINQPCEELAALAVIDMFDRLKNPSKPPSQILSNFELIIGEST
ncbi:transcriptional regulator [Sphaerochaeta pleomorpha str. Grapes]|uniref:Transcriptional regulator n=1 Tax=Sphaerochaeta pleomorpha (strain ATCC BAA-1885 / DSM 22778 / Grapes) TaxID=158190 RepID=G8QTF4_SPHPG|nr:GntR family transcriptional regulator [Sphaerochaeta pleomorpha]AEV30195.1 transcriptional regulator [Sphaerochaeta pleomorpha str. Grapes]